jgi:hypothetical protein
MARKIKIQASQIVITATLDTTPTADAIWEALPLSGLVRRWGDEIYFSIPVNLQETSDARQDMRVGELAFWPDGNAFCIFFGPTPVSAGDEPRAYSNVNPFGQVDEDATLLRAIEDGETVRVDRIEG